MKFDPFPESIESLNLDPVVDKGQSLMSETSLPVIDIKSRKGMLNPSEDLIIISDFVVYKCDRITLPVCLKASRGLNT